MFLGLLTLVVATSTLLLPLTTVLLVQLQYLRQHFCPIPLMGSVLEVGKIPLQFGYILTGTCGPSIAYISGDSSACAYVYNKHGCVWFLSKSFH